LIRTAAVQMTSGPEVAANLEIAAELVGRSAAAGCQLAVLPENFALMPTDDAQRLEAAETDGAGPVQDFLAAAAVRYQMWLVAGTIAIRTADPARVRSACLVYDPSGKRMARYDKIHLFDVELAGGERYRESASIEAGDEPVCVQMPWGGLGLTVCYDLRFPELFRMLAGQGALVFTVPSAFTAVTGRAHWEILLRARAIENSAYVVAPDQGGRHANGRETFGHSMIVDPWGTVLATVAEGAGIAVADIDLERLHKVRAGLPSLQHRRLAH